MIDATNVFSSCYGFFRHRHRHLPHPVQSRTFFSGIKVSTAEHFVFELSHFRFSPSRVLSRLTVAATETPRRSSTPRFSKPSTLLLQRATGLLACIMAYTSGRECIYLSYGQLFRSSFFPKVENMPDPDTYPAAHVNFDGARRLASPLFVTLPRQLLPPSPRSPLR